MGGIVCCLCPLEYHLQGQGIKVIPAKRPLRPVSEILGVFSNMVLLSIFGEVLKGKIKKLYVLGDS